MPGMQSHRSPLRDKHVLVGLTMIVLIAAIVTLASWPIYGKPTLFITAGAAALSGILIAYQSARHRWSFLVTFIVAVLGYVLVALLTAVPWIYRALPNSLLEGLKQVALGPVLSWKSLLTIALPVGDFQDTQIPFFLTIFASTLIATYFVVNTRRTWSFALIPLAVSLLFPTVFGSSAAPETFRLGSLEFPAYLHQIGGLLGFGALLAWPVLRGRSEHAERLKAAAEASPTSARERRARLRQTLIAALMVLVSVAGAALATIPISQWRDRDVPRSSIQNTIELPELTNPLAGYRANFTSDMLDSVLLTIEGDVPRRIRFATLSAYDGVAFRAADPNDAAADLTRFERVPYRVGGTTGELHEARVVVEDYSGPWMPIAEEFSQAEFKGADQLALTSGFYFNTATQTAILKTNRGGSIGVVDGDTYNLIYAEPNILEESKIQIPGALTPPRVPEMRPDEDALPDLYRWMKIQNAGAPTILEIQRLRDRLMERSYLGRSKAEPTGTKTWMPKNYMFRSSDAGESFARINGLFENMLDPRFHACSSPTDQCAAHVGDEEQYAAATAIMARILGFPSRIVYGAKVDVSGEVTGRDTTVWTEVQVADGNWVALDIVPREDNAFIEQPDQDSFRQYNPATDQENADVVDPPAKEPSTAGDEEEEEETIEEESPWLGYVILGLQIFGGVLLVTSPIWGILLAKFLRRRKRRTKGDSADRVLGGWHEYLDRVADTGGTFDASATRNEIAAELGEGASALAVGADFATFSGRELNDEHVGHYWDRVEEERQALIADMGFMAKLRTRLSPKSFGRYRKKNQETTQKHGRLRLRSGKEKVEK